MGRLTLFELEKVWGRRGFLFVAGALFLLNLFLLWYNGLGDGSAPELSAYKALTEELRGMSEAEKDAAVREREAVIDGVAFVRDILSMQSSETGAAFAARELAEHPGKFEAYRDLYASGDYLTYTDSLDQELRFLREVAAEEEKVASYGAFLRSVQETERSLSGISVFSPGETDSFAAENMRKSAEDYRGLSSRGLRWFPSKAVVSAMESVWTDILLILLSFCFVGILITEEKQKDLLSMTRGTRYGAGRSILSKLAALLIHCLFFTALFYLSNVGVFGFAAGWCDLTVRLQSLAPYRESCLSVSILGFMALSVLTKALVLFGAGAVLVLFCILSENGALPYLAGTGFWLVNWAAARFVPAASKNSGARYCNLFAALRTEELYGSYLNLNLWGHPFSRTGLTWLLIGLTALAGCTLSAVFYSRGEKLALKQVPRRDVFSSRPYGSLFRQEGYKLLIVNRGLLILLLFCLLTGANILRRTYTPTAQESYYRDLMLQLEGGLTEEKAALIEAESARYQEAFAEIERIERKVSSGAVSAETGEAMKLRWYSVLTFYPEFLRVEQQLRSVRDTGGRFVYDTGYLYLLGAMGDGELSSFFLLTLGLILALSPVLSMEYQSGAWELLWATSAGKKTVLRRKAAVCSLTAAVFSVVPFACRWVGVARVFPLRGLLFPARSVPFLQGLPASVPLLAVVLGKGLIQVLTGQLLALAVFGLSAWRKNHIQTMVISLLLFCVPLVLTALGFKSAQVFSLYPLYSYVL